jgi:hypothetical protein
MADGAGALSGSPTSNPMQTIDTVLGGEAKREAKQEQDITKSEQDIGAAEKVRTQAHERTQADRLMLKQPTLEQPQTPHVQPTNPLQIWGSLAMMMAGIGSLMTRTPMLSALNAASGVMKGYRERDQAAADAAFKTWKVASENSIQTANFQQKSYDETMMLLDKSDKLSDEEYNSTVKTVEAELRAKATAFGHDTMVDRITVQGVEGAQKMMEQMKTFAVKMEEQIPNLEQAHYFHATMLKMESDPRFKSLVENDPGAAYNLVEQLMPQSMKGMTPNQQVTKENTEQQQISGQPMYKSWAAATVSSAEIAETLKNVKMGTVAVAVAADQFTQTFNGGRAIRGFQMSMLHDNRPLWLEAETLANRVGSGGSLTARELDTMAHAAALAADYLTAAVNKMGIEAQQRAIRQKLNIYNVIPDLMLSRARENPAQFPGLQLPPTQQPQSDNAGAPAASLSAPKSAPPQKSIDYLKAHPDARAQFDQRYGDGAAAQVLGQ